VVNVYLIPGASAYFRPISTLILQGLNPGVFIYSPFAGFGNLVDSIAATAGVDQFGNPYPAGLDLFGGSITGVSFINGQVTGSSIYASNLFSPNISMPIISGGSATEMAVEFDSAGGQLLSYSSAGFTIVTLTGSGTWTVPAGVTHASIKAIGGGGGGGHYGSNAGGSGGGGGEVAVEASYPLTPGAGVLYSVGQGGSGGTGGAHGAGGGGGPGTDSSFDSGGILAHGGEGGNNQSTPGYGYGGGQWPGHGTSVNTVHFNGGNGGGGSFSGGAGGGVGGATPSGIGTAGSTSSTGAGAAGGTTGGGAGGASGVAGTAGTATTGGGGGGAGEGSGSSTFDNIYYPVHTYSYYGADASFNPANGLRDTDSTMFQGEDTFGFVNGNQYSFALYNYAAIEAALVGQTIDNVYVSCPINYETGSNATLVIGYSAFTTFGSTGSLAGATQNVAQATVPIGTQIVDLSGLGFGTAFQNGTAKNLLFGPGPTTSDGYFLEMSGGPGSSGGPSLEIKGHSGVAGTAGGAGASGTIVITYATPGGFTLTSSISPAAGTDQYGNTYPPGIAGIDEGVSYVRLNALEQVAWGPLPFVSDDITIGRQSAGILSVVDTSALFYGSIWQDSRTPSVDSAPANAYDWTLITPNSQWTNRGGATPKLACRKIASPPNGVQIQGEVIWTSTGSALVSGTVIGTMSSAFFPNTERLLTCVVSSVTGTFTRTSPLDVPINVTTTGQLKIFNLTGGAVSGNNVLIQLWGTFSLDGP
jgi:hypothetical protein